MQRHRRCRRTRRLWRIGGAATDRRRAPYLERIERRLPYEDRTRASPGLLRSNTRRECHRLPLRRVASEPACRDKENGKPAQPVCTKRERPPKRSAVRRGFERQTSSCLSALAPPCIPSPHRVAPCGMTASTTSGSLGARENRERPPRRLAPRRQSQFSQHNALTGSPTGQTDWLAREKIRRRTRR